MKKSNLIRIQTKDNLIILINKTNTLITLTTFIKKYEKKQEGQKEYVIMSVVNIHYIAL